MYKIFCDSFTNVHKRVPFEITDYFILNFHIIRNRKEDGS